jgi:arginyl-tRNA synthetase
VLWPAMGYNDNIFYILMGRQPLDKARVVDMEHFKEQIALILEGPTGLNREEIRALLEVPPNPDLGDYAFPCFRLARTFKKNPAEIASRLAVELRESPLLARVSQAGPYLNFVLKRSLLAEDILHRIRKGETAYGSSSRGEGRAVVIDFSSPNIAKPFGVGHLRSTVIGHSLHRLYTFLGYKAVGINHLGDWGTQFGKIISAYKNWGSEAELNRDPIDYLFQLYVRFHSEEEQDPRLEEEGRYWFKELEAGNREALALWQTFRDLSLREFQRIYQLLGIDFDSYQGESFYNDRLEDTIQQIVDRGITRESQGALIVDLGEDMPPCLLRKKDGATLYVTRDLSAALYRYERYRFAKALYVVGADQILHFRQFFKVLKLMGLDWADRCEHVPFGLVRFKDGKMSTRKGKVVLLEEVLNKAVQLSLDIIAEKNPSLAAKETVARQVGIGAIIFGDLSNDRIKDVEFDWDKILDFSGETGPYIQYSHARICSILRKEAPPPGSPVRGEVYTAKEEEILLLQLGRFPETVERAAELNKPSIIARYLIDLARDFNQFYHHCPVLKAEGSIKTGRLILVDAVRQVLARGLYLLGIEAPEEM